MSKATVALALVAAGMLTQAAVAATSEQSGIVRCGVDASVAYGLLVPIREGESEDLAIAKLAPDLAATARGLRALHAAAIARRPTWQLTEADIAELLRVEQEQGEDWELAFQEAETAAAEEALFSELLD